SVMGVLHCVEPKPSREWDTGACGAVAAAPQAKVKSLPLFAYYFLPAAALRIAMLRSIALACAATTSFSYWSWLTTNWTCASALISWKIQGQSGPGSPLRHHGI